MYMNLKEFKKHSEVLERQIRVQNNQFKTQYVQSAEQRKNDLYNRTFDQIKRLEDREFRKIRYFIFYEWNGEYPLRNKMSMYGKDFHERDREAMIKEFSNTMDVMGKLYLEKSIDQDLIINTYGRFIQDAWEKCGSFIEYEQKKRNKISGEEKKTKYTYQFYFKAMYEDVKKRYPTDPILKKEIEILNEEENSN